MCYGLTLNLGKQSRNQGNIRKISRKTTSLIWQTPVFSFIPDIYKGQGAAKVSWVFLRVNHYLGYFVQSFKLRIMGGGAFPFSSQVSATA